MLHRDWTFLDAITDRLLHSRNPAERRSIYQGHSYHQGIPVLLDTDLLFEHKHIVGPPGMGKTTLGLQTDALQLIRRNDGPLVIFDCKGDPAFFNSIRSAAKRAGRTFKWFTNKPFRSTYVFNPWDNRLLKKLSLPDTTTRNTTSLPRTCSTDGSACRTPPPTATVRPRSASRSTPARGLPTRIFSMSASTRTSA